MRELVAALAVGAPFVVGASVGPADDATVVLRFRDPAIVESSGLVVTRDLVVTVNDSGDSARIFTVDLGTGRTVGVTSWDAEATDLEALAPAGPGHVWVADIGDNFDARDDISVTRVPFGRSDRAVAGESYALRYEGGPADAEALLTHPRTGRLYVATKGVMGGSLLEAPARLSTDGPNRMRRIGGVPGLLTDGAFFPDGRHLVLRNYGTATVLTFPGLEEVGSFALPAQQQGEGIAVAPDGRIYLSSEGSRSPLLRVPLPDEIRDAVSAPATAPSSPSPSPSPSPSTRDRQPPEPDDRTEEDLERDPWPWLMGGLLGVVGVVVLIRSLRPR